MLDLKWPWQPRSVTAAELEQQRSLVLLDEVVDSIIEPMYMTDVRGCIRLANTAFEQQVGQPKTAFMGKALVTVYPPAVYSMLRDAIASLEAGAPRAAVEYKLRNHRGLFREWRHAIIPFRRNGQLEGYVGTIRDITEVASMLHDLKAEKERAVAASDAKNEFLAVMSHELRTPLTSVLGYAELLKDGLGGPLTEGQAQFTERIQEATTHLVGVIEQILDYTGIERATAGSRKEFTNVCDIIQQAVNVVELMALKKNVTISCQIPGHAIAMGDGGRLRQVMLNLLSNAVKFTPPKGTVGVSLDDSPDGIEVRVRDSGVGLSADELAQVFDPFWQAAPSRTRREGGIGLGLTITHKLLTSMGGSITIESPGKNQGCTVKAIIPKNI